MAPSSSVEIIVTQSYEAASAVVAQAIATQLAVKPDSCLGMLLAIQFMVVMKYWLNNQPKNKLIGKEPSFLP